MSSKKGKIGQYLTGWDPTRYVGQMEPLMQKAHMRQNGCNGRTKSDYGDKTTKLLLDGPSKVTPYFSKIIEKAEILHQSTSASWT